MAGRINVEPMNSEPYYGSFKPEYPLPRLEDPIPRLESLVKECTKVVKECTKERNISCAKFIAGMGVPLGLVWWGVEGYSNDAGRRVIDYILFETPLPVSIVSITTTMFLSAVAMYNYPQIMIDLYHDILTKNDYIKSNKHVIDKMTGRSADLQK